MYDDETMLESGARFTNDFFIWIQIRWPIRFPVIPLK